MSGHLARADVVWWALSAASASMGRGCDCRQQRARVIVTTVPVLVPGCGGRGVRTCPAACFPEAYLRRCADGHSRAATDVEDHMRVAP